MRFLYGLFFLLVFSGCATTNPSQFSTDSGDGIKWKQLVLAGISEDAKFGMFSTTTTVIGKSNFFTSDTEKITWWGQVKPLSFYNAAKFHIKWYQPDEKLFWEEDFSYADDLVRMLYKTSIPIKGAPAQNLLGIWKVEVFYKDNLIDRRKFYINPPESAGATNASSKPVPQSLALPESLPENSMNAQLKERYEKAQIYIKNKMYPEATQNLQSILKEEPSQTEAHFALATIYFRQTKWDDCLSELDYVVQNPQYRDRAMNIRSMVLEMKQAPEKNRAVA